MNETRLLDLIQLFNTPTNDGIRGFLDDEPLSFFSHFIGWLNDGIKNELLTIEFNGNGGYFGKQVAITLSNATMRFNRDLAFEVAYSDSDIVIYTANHNGFWTPSYYAANNLASNFHSNRIVLLTKIQQLFGIVL